MNALGTFMVVGAMLDIVCEYRWLCFDSDIDRSGSDEGMVTDPNTLAFFDEIDPIIADCRKALDVLAQATGAPNSASLSVQVRRLALHASETDLPVRWSDQ